MVCIIPQKIVSPKRLKVEKIVALPFEDLQYVKFLGAHTIQGDIVKNWMDI